MSEEKKIVFVRGPVHWARVIGEPVLNYGKDGREWKLDVSLDEKGLKTIKDLGLSERIKDKGDDRGKFISLKQKEFKNNGDANLPPKVYDADGAVWDSGTLIGNNSVCDVKFEYRNYGKGMKAGVYLKALRVLKLNEYKSQEFAPLGSDDEFFSQEAPKYEGAGANGGGAPFDVDDEDGGF